MLCLGSFHWPVLSRPTVQKSAQCLVAEWPHGTHTVVTICSVDGSTVVADTECFVAGCAHGTQTVVTMCSLDGSTVQS